MRSRTTIEIYAYWDGLRRNRDAPNRSEIDPSQVRHILPDLFILERTARGDIRFRLAGTRICGLFARELRGSRFDSLWLGEQMVQLAGIAFQVMANATPVVLSASTKNSTGDLLTAEIVLLPLRSPNGAIDRIIGSLTPLSRPVWLEATPVNFLELKNLRALDAPSVNLLRSHQVKDLTEHKIAPVQEHSLAGVLRRVLHLRLLEGGRRD
ncbi:PAS domain-containing protein [Pararhizobium gei]|uniref:PAS domain-containing protein n=1 Tax=Pararhizobium gei TaxID=1395951 RepID=UPI0023DCB2AA|nr:PAS domain-containing protein [Rhizobium gei]